MNSQMQSEVERIMVRQGDSHTIYRPTAAGRAQQQGGWCEANRVEREPSKWSTKSETVMACQPARTAE